MRARRVRIVLGTLALVAALAATRRPNVVPGFASGQPTVEAVVSRVWDGMSLDARVDDRRTAVGYLGAETAAGNTPCGQVALERNRELAGGRVLLEADATYEFDAI